MEIVEKGLNCKVDKIFHAIFWCWKEGLNEEDWSCDVWNIDFVVKLHVKLYLWLQGLNCKKLKVVLYLMVK